ncbi:type IV pilus modification protein PilV [Ideonella livida]|uniref:Type IV pilus modification protein PilV n=1 Tax=Ideonella livida TaxID=2707176 RepID=A0A7C9TLJ3_9BURK|nr:type IV pilus modification protein PilV [Ideonella livida]NDY92085.1 type IV pilus modification protein PilV [Ideonella livida]
MSRTLRLPGRRMRRAARGVMLIEVLVSLVLFAIGVLGLVALQATATRLSTEAGERHRASLMAQELVAAMWAAQTVSLDTATLAAWESRLTDTTASGLPDATYDLSPGADAVTLTITWTSVARGSAAAQGRYVTEFALPG